MAHLYQPNEFIPVIRGTIRDSLSLSLHDASEVEAFGLFCVETMSPGPRFPETTAAVQEQLRQLRDRMPAFEQWSRSTSLPSDARRNAFERATEESEAAAAASLPSAQLLLSLAAARDLMMLESSDDDRLLTLVSIRPQSLGQPGEYYEADEPALVFHEGSWRCSLTGFVEPAVKFVLSAGSFAVAIVRASVAPASTNAREIVEEVRGAAVRRAKHKDLLALEDLRPGQIAGKKGIILLLHGLFSTDIATFDGFIDAWRDDREFAAFSAGTNWGAKCGIATAGLVEISSKPRAGDFRKAFLGAIDEDFLIVGWAHDTLTTIVENAAQLVAQIDARLGDADMPIVVVCHSRGGLVARKLAIQAKAYLRARLRLCVTFGTPHEGAPFAERENPIDGVATTLMLVTETGQGITVARTLAYLRQERTIRGIADLAPSSVGRGGFLATLRAEEREAAGQSRRQRDLPILPIGGHWNSPSGSRQSWIRRVLRLIVNTQLQEKHDLVVALESSRPDVGFDDVLKGGLDTDCDHVSYFTDDQIQRVHFRKVIDQVRAALGFDAAVCDRVRAAQPERDEHLRIFEESLPNKAIFRLKKRDS